MKILHDAGLLIAAGTDAPHPGVFQGEGLHRELELLVQAGMTPLAAISSATRNAAQFIGSEKEWGTLEPGIAPTSWSSMAGRTSVFREGVKDSV